MKTSDRENIRKMIKYCEDVASLLEEYNNDYESYVNKISFQYSCNMCIIQIGELVGRLSDELLDAHKEIPWYAIKGMRNLHAHDYERVNYKTVWNTLQTEIPELKNRLEQMLDDE